MKLHNKDNLIQNITLCNIFSKKVYAVYNGVWGKTPEAGKFSRIFVLKVTLQVTFNCKFQKKLGEHWTGFTTCFPIILLGATAPPAPPVPVPM